MIEDDVLEAAKNRFEIIFLECDQVYFSISGGKDSGVMVYLANEVAMEKHVVFDLFILDIEVNYKKTIEFIEKIKRLPAVRDIYHFCLPFYEDNCTSIFQPQWMMWNPKEKDKWVREIPSDAITLQDLDSPLHNYYLKSNLNPDRFMRYFLLWYQQKYSSQKVACGIGIRAQESLYRYNAVKNGLNKYKNYNWTNQIGDNCFNFYPIYDWSVEDIWGAVSLYDFEYNQVYEGMYKMGMNLHEMRICQPFGLQQRKGLEQFAKIEPETWSLVVDRVSGANFGNLYAKTSLLGHNKTSKPKNMTWQTYAVFLLESMGLYSEGLRNHYHRKIRILMDYYKKNFHMTVEDMPDNATRKQWLQDERLWHNWKGIARALEKNDFALTTRSYSLTKADERELYELHQQYQSMLGIELLKGKQYGNIVKKLKVEAKSNDKIIHLSPTSH